MNMKKQTNILEILAIENFVYINILKEQLKEILN